MEERDETNRRAAITSNSSHSFYKKHVDPSITLPLPTPSSPHLTLSLFPVPPVVLVVLPVVVLDVLDAPFDMIRTSRPSSVHSVGTEVGDPFAARLRPPPGESEHERQLRLQQEAEAKRISDNIDEELKQDARRLQKRKEDVTVRLLLFTAFPTPSSTPLSGASPPCEGVPMTTDPEQVSASTQLTPGVKAYLLIHVTFITAIASGPS